VQVAQPVEREVHLVGGVPVLPLLLEDVVEDQLAEQLGLNIVTLRIFGPDRIILVVVDADDIDSVRNFALQSRLMQWNTVKIHATYSIEEAVGMIDELEPIF